VVAGNGKQHGLPRARWPPYLTTHGDPVRVVADNHNSMNTA
jgi:hypothetical protein